MRKLQFNNATNIDSNSSYIGGGALLEKMEDWPLNTSTGKPMTPFITLHQGMFYIPTIPDGMAITVFIMVKKSKLWKDNYIIPNISNITFGDMLQLNPSGKFPPPVTEPLANITQSLVLLHKTGEKALFHPEAEHLPLLEIIGVEASEEECEADNEDELVGLQISKFSGRAGWLQDDLFIHDRYPFCLQIFESDLAEANPVFNGLLNDGAGYLMLDQNIKKQKSNCQSGYFIVQFT